MIVNIQIPQSAIRRMNELEIPQDKQVELYTAYVLDALGLVDNVWTEIMFNDWTNEKQNIEWTR